MDYTLRDLCLLRREAPLLEPYRLKPGNANLPIGGLCNANREIGVPGGRHFHLFLARIFFQFLKLLHQLLGLIAYLAHAPG